MTCPNVPSVRMPRPFVLLLRKRAGEHSSPQSDGRNPVPDGTGKLADLWSPHPSSMSDLAQPGLGDRNHSLDRRARLAPERTAPIDAPSVDAGGSFRERRSFVALFKSTTSAFRHLRIEPLAVHYCLDLRQVLHEGGSCNGNHNSHTADQAVCNDGVRF